MKYMGFFPVVHPDEQQKGKSESGPEMSAASGRKKKPKKDGGKVNPKGNFLTPVSKKLFSQHFVYNSCLFVACDLNYPPERKIKVSKSFIRIPLVK